MSMFFHIVKIYIVWTEKLGLRILTYWRKGMHISRLRLLVKNMRCRYL
mgnify:CR=1 FL=1